MQAQTTPRHPNNALTWVVAGFGVLLLLLLFLSFMADTRPPGSSATTSSPVSNVAYLEFGTTADTLWLAPAADLTSRQKLISIPHAAEYGIIPSVSPDGKWFAYTALPENTAAPAPDSPAELWVSGLGPEATRSLLADNVDLLVPPVWTPDGESVAYRRTTADGHAILVNSLTGEDERVLAASATDTLFPVGFSADGESLYFAALSETNGSTLMQVGLAGTTPQEVARLSPGLTRDWALSPDGSQLAFLQVAYSESDMASRAFVLNLEDGSMELVSDSQALAFGPVWGARDQLTLGLFDPASGQARLTLTDGVEQSTIAGPATGFEVPLAQSEDGGILVQAFENNSLASPGRSSLVLVEPDGSRRTVSEEEVTLVGWTRP